MLTNKQFAARLESIRKTDEKFRELIAETLAFALFHARNHGQKTPFNELVAAVPGWLKKDMGKVALSKLPKNKQITEEQAASEAAFRVAEWFASHEERKAINNANRKARVASPKVEAAVTEQESVGDENTVVVEAEYVLIGGGDVMELTSEEYALILEAVAEFRRANAPMLKAA